MVNLCVQIGFFSGSFKTALKMGKRRVNQWGRKSFRVDYNLLYIGKPLAVVLENTTLHGWSLISNHMHSSEQMHGLVYYT